MSEKAKQDQHKKWMHQALKLAERAYAAQEVPVGALVVQAGRVIGRGYNRTEAKQDPTQHAELVAIRQACKKQQTWRLDNCTLYVTLEPCAMCAGAITWSRISTVYYAANDPKAGAYQSVVPVLANKKLNHRPKVISGILAKESAELLKAFFTELRVKKKSPKLIMSS